MQFFTAIEKKILNFIWKYKGPRMKKTMFNINETDGAVSIPDSKWHYRVMKVVWCWHKNRFVISSIELRTTYSPYSTPTATWFLTNRLQYTLGKKIVSSTNGSLILLCSYLEMDEIRRLSLMLHKTQFQTDQRHQHRTWYLEPDRGKNIGNIFELRERGRDFLKKVLSTPKCRY